MLRRLAALLLLTVLCGGAKAQIALPHEVTRALAAARVPEGGVAVVVTEVGAPRATISINAAAPMNPASVMKLITAFAALELLGPAFRWTTDAFAEGSLKDGVLEGNLVLKGSGDPRLDVEAFWMLLRALRGKGLREIRGELVLDRSHFMRVEGDPGRFDGDVFRPYNVQPDALLVNYKSLRFAFAPEPEQGTVRLYVEPRPPALEVVNQLRLTSGPCREGFAFREMLKPTFESAPPRAVFAGQYPVSCGEKDLNVALLAPNDHVAGILRQLWPEIGGAWTGAVRDGQVAPQARLLHRHESPALAEIVRDMNKFSNNVIARQMYLTLGAEPPPASAQKSAVAVRTWLSRRGLAATELVLDNGSGLSRIERVSATTLAALLQAAWRSAVMPEFVASMPVVAVDGTMRRRLRGDGVAGQAHIKTGLLAEVRSMAGYVLDRRGRRQVVIMMVNHANAHDAQPAMDALLRWVYERD